MTFLFEERAKRYKHATFGMLFIEGSPRMLDQFAEAFGASGDTLYGVNRFSDNHPSGIFARAQEFEQAFVIIGPHNPEEATDFFESGHPDAMRLPKFGELIDTGALVLFYANGHSSIEVFFPCQNSAEVFDRAARFFRNCLEPSELPNG